MLYRSGPFAANTAGTRSTAKWLTAYLGVSLALPATAAFSPDLRMEPQPFRQTQVIEGRSFDYNAESFMHRASFAPPRPVNAVANPQDHITGTGGSSRSDELFLDMSIQKTHDFTEQAHFQYRFRRTEDFDGYYDRNLVGLGYRHNSQIEARMMAEVFGDKSRIDLQPELSWQPSQRLEFRGAVVLTDELFNDKQNDDLYRSSPVTWFLATEWQPTDNHGLRAYINLTPQVELEIDDQILFGNRSGRSGLAWDWQIAPGHHWQWLAEGEATDRDSRLLGQSETDTMTRRYWRTRIEYQRNGLSPLDFRIGGQFLFLREEGDFIGDTQELTDREESMVFVGTGWSVADNWTFTPTIFAAHVTGESFEREAPEQVSEDLDGNYAKITLPFTWQPDGPQGARVTLNPTLRLHRAAFGGGNLSVSIPL